MTKLHSLILALLVTAATAAAGCLGADSEVDPEPAADDDGADGDKTGEDSGSGTGEGDAPTVVNDRPKARLSITNDQDPTNETRRGFKGDVLKLNGAKSSDPDGHIVNWTWTVVEPSGGDDAPASTKYYGEVVSGVQFGTEGVKIVTLTVTDNVGATADASATYYRDVSYSYGGEQRWEQITGPVNASFQHKLPVLAGAAVLAASIQVDGAKAEIVLLDPDGTEHVRGVTETDNVTIVMDHGAPVAGEWTVIVNLQYEPAGLCAPEAGCHPEVPLVFQAAHEAQYGMQGNVWYGEAPEDLTVSDGHGDHDH